MRDLLQASMTWMDAFWDDHADLLWMVKRDRHMTRESASYALGLLERAGAGDVERAQKALRAVLRFQFDEPGAPYDGTFKRYPEEDDPPSEPLMWIHYDPNWRQFIGATFAVICDRFGDALDEDLVDALRRSIAAAVEGEGDDRVSPTYANIALMKAWLDAWSGRIDTAERFATQIHEHFAANNAFLEYNSPTYYGIDLWALALWRTTPKLAQLGARMERELWTDIARFYHAGLKNVCGPYDRAYGMDMTAHATPLGLSIWAALGSEIAPFPDPDTRFRHPHDFCFGPPIALFPPDVPDEVRPDLTIFRGERTVERTITTFPERVATAWLADDVMVGGQVGPPSGIGFFQHHHATVHWAMADGGIGWARVVPEASVEATAEPGRLVITADGPVTLEIHPQPELIARGWRTGGRVIGVEGASGPGALEDHNRVVCEPSRGRLTLVVET